jgi:diguanylate cyclase (GGDEF)-like protein
MARKTVTIGEMGSLGTWARDSLNVHQDGTVFRVRLRSDVLGAGQGVRRRIITTCEEITQDQRALDAGGEATLEEPLTGLFNRAFFLELVDRAANRSERHADYHFAVLLMDLDRFKLINESLGHDAGDLLLVSVAERLKGSIRPSDVAARIAGDQFAVLLDGLVTPTDAVQVAERIIKELDPAFTVADREVYLTPNIGIVQGTATHTNPERYLKDAAVAMRSARAAGQGHYGIFDHTTKRRATVRLQLETDLRKAIDRKELRAVYQPIVDLRTEATIGFEALVRWQHPDQGMIAPGEFIPAAEETGLVVPIGSWMLEAACEQLAAWQQQLPDCPPVTVNVNLSVRQLRQPRLLEHVLGALDRAGVPPDQLKVEVTESMLMEDPEMQVETLRRLRAAGIGVVIDDFGTGYSSLSYLQRFDFDSLKIDRSFLPTEGSEQGWDIVKMIIGLAHDKEAAVVAEGVETQHQVARLLELGCDRVQGYWFAKPLDAEAATERLRLEMDR